MELLYPSAAGAIILYVAVYLYREISRHYEYEQERKRDEWLKESLRYSSDLRDIIRDVRDAKGTNKHRGSQL